MKSNEKTVQDKALFLEETINWAKNYSEIKYSLPDEPVFELGFASQINSLFKVKIAHSELFYKIRHEIKESLKKLRGLEIKLTVVNLNPDITEKAIKIEKASIAPRLNELKKLIDGVELVLKDVNSLHEENKIPNVNKDKVEKLVGDIQTGIEQLEGNLLSHSQKIACAFIMLVTGIGFFVSSFLLAMALVPVSPVVAPAIVEVAVGAGSFVLGGCVGKLLFKKGLFRCDKVKSEIHNNFNKDVTDYLKVGPRAPSPATL